MKYIRFQLRKGSNYLRIRALISFLVIIPIFAIVIGGFLARFIIVPMGQKSNADLVDNKNVLNVINKSKKEYSFFILQAGAFMNRNNANLLVNAIEKSNEKAYVIMEEGLYRVIIAVEADKNKLGVKKDKLESMGYACLINEIGFNMLDIENVNIKNYIGLNLEVMNKQIEKLRNEKEININEIAEMMNSVEKSYSVIDFKGEINNSNEKIKKIYEDYINDLNLKGGNDIKYVYEEMVIIKAFFKSLEKKSNASYSIVNNICT